MAKASRAKVNSSTWAYAHDFVDKSGAWYSYQGDRIGQGKENVRQFLKDNPDIANAIEKQIRDEMMPAP